MISDQSDWLLSLGAVALADADLTELRGMLGASLGDDVAGVTAVLKASRLIGLAGDPAAVFDGAMFPADETGLAYVSALIAAAFASVRLELEARPDATLVRKQLSALADKAYAAAGAQSVDAMAFCISIAGVAIDEISKNAATLAPIVRVETGISIPSSLLAYDLYGDAERGHELVLRNKHGAPMLMPLVCEAISQ